MLKILGYIGLGILGLMVIGPMLPAWASAGLIAVLFMLAALGILIVRVLLPFFRIVYIVNPKK
jgi:hypothetical protein